MATANAELGADLRAKIAPSDLVQETYAEAGRDFDSFLGQQTEELRAWLRRILLNNLSNAARSYRNSDKRDITRERAFDSEVCLPAHDETPSREIARDELFIALRASVQGLPEEYRMVIEWRNYSRLSFEEIGQRMNRSADAARKV